VQVAHTVEEVQISQLLGQLLCVDVMIVSSISKTAGFMIIQFNNWMVDIKL
jgi:hypothetical protein